MYSPSNCQSCTIASIFLSRSRDHFHINKREEPQPWHPIAQGSLDTPSAISNVPVPHSFYLVFVMYSAIVELSHDIFYVTKYKNKIYFDLYAEKTIFNRIRFTKKCFENENLG